MEPCEIRKKTKRDTISSRVTVAKCRELEDGAERLDCATPWYKQQRISSARRKSGELYRIMKYVTCRNTLGPGEPRLVAGPKENRISACEGRQMQQLIGFPQGMAQFDVAESQLSEYICRKKETIYNTTQLAACPSFRVPLPNKLVCEVSSSVSGRRTTTTSITYVPNNPIPLKNTNERIRHNSMRGYSGGVNQFLKVMIEVYHAVNASII